MLGPKDNLAIDDDDLIQNVIPEQDAFTSWIRLDHCQEQMLQVLNRDKDKLSTKIREFMLDHGVTTKKELAEGLGQKPDTIKKQLERLVKNRRIINAGYGKYGLSEHQRKGFAAMVALRKVHETDGTKVFNVHEHCGFRNGRFWYDKLWVIYRRAGEDAEEREAAFIAHFPVYSRVYDKEAEDQKEIRKREVVYVERKPPTLVDMVATMRELQTP